MVGYDCEKDGKKVLKSYYEKNNFLNRINELYDKEYASLDEVEECLVVEKTLFRDMKLVR